MVLIMDIEDEEKSLELPLWQACAGAMVQMPKVNSKVLYFPQGHGEHATKKPEFSESLIGVIPPIILCRVSHINFLAESETDEVYAKIGLVPLKISDYDRENDDDDDDDNDDADAATASATGGLLGLDVKNNDKLKIRDKIKSFAKVLTQSDANNGGGFSVPRHCAENIYPELDYKAQPPVQNIMVKDVHGKVWKFRHIYRGTPRRHLLTTGWSNFVNNKRLIAGDTVVFLKTENEEICVGIRRAKKKGFGVRSLINNSSSSSSGGAGSSNPDEENGGGRVKRNRNGANKCSRLGGGGRRGKLKPESVIEAVKLAVNGHPFEVVLYPRASPPPFIVKASAFKSAMKINWCSGMRFRMAIETEDSGRISSFMGSISSVQVDDPNNWPNSPWRILEVVWDEPDLLPNIKYVNPWMVEPVSNIPTINLTRFSESPGKKLRVPQPHPPPEIPFTFQQLPVTSSFLSNNTNNNNPLSPSSVLCCLSDNNNNGGGITAGGIQGARHFPQFGLVPSPEKPIFYHHHHHHHQQGLGLGLIPFQFDPVAPPPEIQFDVMGNSLQQKENNNKIVYLFGKPLLTEKQMNEFFLSTKKEK